MPLKILILGANGFIGSALTAAILARHDWEVFGLDVASHKLEECLGHPRFRFLEGDIMVNHEWIEYHVSRCDVVIPLVAIANPIQYGRDPLRVFELDFEANLAVVRQCVKHRKRLVFPSTSEVYGMSPDPRLDESRSPLVYGPIERQRWIYACSKAAARSRDLRLRGARWRRLHAVPALQLDRPEARRRLRREGGQLAPLHAVHLQRDLRQTAPARRRRPADALVHLHR
jgi:nucleoside-diphosphate-sugar epimerase